MGQPTVTVVIPTNNRKGLLPRALASVARQIRLPEEVIVVDDGYDLFLSLILYPTFAWDDEAYHLEGDPNARAFGELIIDIIAADIIEPWGGGKWHLEIFRSSEAEPEDWNGEI